MSIQHKGEYPTQMWVSNTKESIQHKVEYPKQPIQVLHVYDYGLEF